MRLMMTTDTVGGVWTFTRELTAGLLKSGCGVLLVSFGRRPSADQLAEVHALSASGSFQYVPSEAKLEWMPDNEQAYAAAEPLMLQLCHEYQPDVLLLNQFCFGALDVPIAKIIVAHSDVLSWAEATGKAPLPNDTWLRTYRTLVQAGLNGADAVIAPTHAALTSTATHFQMPGATEVIPNGHDVVATSAHRKLQAVTAGRMWDPAKNLSILRTLRTSMPILVAGEHEGSVSDSPNLRLLGSLTQEDLLALFQQSAIYICCSFYEPFGLAALEAALCGCAVIAQDIPSLREVWDDSALYFTDTASAETLLSELARDAERLQKLQAASQKRARQFSRDRMTQSYLAVLSRQIDAKAEGQARAA